MKKIYSLILILFSVFLRINAQSDSVYSFYFNDMSVVSIDTFKNNGSGEIDVYSKNERLIVSVKIVINNCDSITLSLIRNNNVFVKLEKKQVETSAKLESDNFKFYAIKTDKQKNNISVFRMDFAYSKKFEIYDLLIIPLVRHISYKKRSLTFSEQF